MYGLKVTIIAKLTDNNNNNYYFHAVVDCEPLSAPTNGDVKDPVTTYQSVATYQCNTGYDLIGESSRTCQADGNWSEQEPICQSN